MKPPPDNDFNEINKYIQNYGEELKKSIAIPSGLLGIGSTNTPQSKKEFKHAYNKYSFICDTGMTPEEFAQYASDKKDLSSEEKDLVDMTLDGGESYGELLELYEKMTGKRIEERKPKIPIKKIEEDEEEEFY